MRTNSHATRARSVRDVLAADVPGGRDRRSSGRDVRSIPGDTLHGLRAIRVTIDTPLQQRGLAAPLAGRPAGRVRNGHRRAAECCGFGRSIPTRAGRWPAPAALESPFWSPDSRLLAFFADGRLKTIDIDSGRIETLTDVGRPRGGDWNKDGIILFCSDTGIDRMQSDGSRRQHVTELDRVRGEYQHGWPQFLPDGRRFLYVVRSNVGEQAGVYLGSLDSKTATRLMPAYSRIVYAPTGHLLYVRHGTLMAQSFDARAGRITGEPQGSGRTHQVSQRQRCRVRRLGQWRADLSTGRRSRRPHGSCLMDRRGRRTPNDCGCRLLQTAAVLHRTWHAWPSSDRSRSRPTRTSGSTTSPIAARRG